MFWTWERKILFWTFLFLKKKLANPFFWPTYACGWTRFFWVRKFRKVIFPARKNIKNLTRKVLYIYLFNSHAWLLEVRIFAKIGSFPIFSFPANLTFSTQFDFLSQFKFFDPIWFFGANLKFSTLFDFFESI